MTEAEKRRAEAIWTYRISQEKVLKSLVARGIFTQEHANYMSDYLLEQLNLLDVPGSHLSSIGEKMINANRGHSPYVSLTDIAREKNSKSPGYLIQSWLRNSNSIEYLRLWEKRFNPSFLDDECEKLIQTIRTSSATLTPKIWISVTKAVGIESRAGKNGGTMAHPEIAEAFRAWLFPEVMLKMVKRYRCFQPELDESPAHVSKAES
ncbi:KilA-N domain-containing protein [Desulfosporosinus youngiae]|uniref:KilA-N domain-containing protein n=1 Tax=Desulfosporosinus youngiae DSM 17734 TaxID=768710 RepID=H5XU28_9FIRM|nr:KilA-N domain-containing protein [Desulfosporosinus youngiae]EHQ88986.1 KilA-N domain-containing protein [Desulfosporosinus youngiae DSM 17734]